MTAAAGFRLATAFARLASRRVRGGAPAGSLRAPARGPDPAVTDGPVDSAERGRPRGTRASVRSAEPAPGAAGVAAAFATLAGRRAAVRPSRGAGGSLSPEDPGGAGDGETSPPAPGAAGASAARPAQGPGGLPPEGRRAGAEPHVLYVHFGEGAREHYPRLLELLADLTPVVQALPPDAALADVRGALRYFRRDAAALATLLRTRVLALYGSDCTVGVAANPLLARMAAHDGPPGGVRCVPAGAAGTAAFLERKPVAALHGVGPATARTLCAYGLDTVDRVAAAPPATLQRILGAAAGRRLRDQARGIDSSTVVPSSPARSTSREHRFRRDELDAAVRRRALLSLADELGFRMRTEGQVARALTLTVRCADRSTVTRTRRLPEPTAHTPALTALAYALHDALGLQRARVRAVALRAEELTAAEFASRQLSLDPGEDRARRAEAAADRARLRFGPGAAHPAGGLGAA